jgi:ferrous iron transport protein B
MIQVALAGNPNTGKTSLFNNLTGSYEYVGNWAGVTVEKKVGTLKQVPGLLIDLPGIYSLNPVSRDEGVATQYLLSEKFSAILNIVDASQLERNLYLTVQLLEFEKPLLIGLNMIDVARNRGIQIDYEQLSALLGVPIQPIVARTGDGCSRLPLMLQQSSEQSAVLFRLDYGSILEQGINRLTELLPTHTNLPSKRWIALQFFEENPIVTDLLSGFVNREQLLDLRQETERLVQEKTGARSLHQYIRQVRGSFISDIVKRSVRVTKQATYTMTEQVDRIVTNKFLGIPVFLLFMFLVFQFTFDWAGTPLSDLLDAFFTGPLAGFFEQMLTLAGTSGFIEALILEGILPGVGGVLVFVPQIFILFLIISFIEDSGYMARVAMVMDRMMEGVGLNGKAFIPMIIGFGCNVPGIMAARTIEQPKERLITTLLTPLMSCSARLTVYSLFAGALFQTHQALVVLSLYVIGIVVALLLAHLFSTYLFKQESSIFLVELPPYRLPQWKTLLRSTWEKGKGFIKKAGTFIFGGSVVIWLLGYTGPSGLHVDINNSFLAAIGGLIAPWLTPLGFGTWQAGAALLTGFFAKEVVVTTMNILYAPSAAETLQGAVANVYTPLQAYSFMAFLLLYVPCFATLATIRKEAASARWTWFTVGYALFIAYLVALVIYQGGRLMGFE